MQSVNEAQFFNIIFKYALFASTAAAITRIKESVT